MAQIPADTLIVRQAEGETIQAVDTKAPVVKTPTTVKDTLKTAPEKLATGKVYADSTLTSTLRKQADSARIASAQQDSLEAASLRKSNIKSDTLTTVKKSVAKTVSITDSLETKSSKAGMRADSLQETRVTDTDTAALTPAVKKPAISDSLLVEPIQQDSLKQKSPAVKPVVVDKRIKGKTSTGVKPDSLQTKPAKIQDTTAVTPVVRKAVLRDSLSVEPIRQDSLRQKTPAVKPVVVDKRIKEKSTTGLIPDTLQTKQAEIQDTTTTTPVVRKAVMMDSLGVEPIRQDSLKQKTPAVKPVVVDKRVKEKSSAGLIPDTLRTKQAEIQDTIATTPVVRKAVIRDSLSVEPIQLDSLIQKTPAVKPVVTDSPEKVKSKVSQPDTQQPKQTKSPDQGTTPVLKKTVSPDTLSVKPIKPDTLKIKTAIVKPLVADSLVKKKPAAALQADSIQTRQKKIQDSTITVPAIVTPPVTSPVKPDSTVIKKVTPPTLPDSIIQKPAIKPESQKTSNKARTFSPVAGINENLKADEEETQPVTPIKPAVAVNEAPEASVTAKPRQRTFSPVAGINESPKAGAEETNYVPPVKTAAVATSTIPATAKPQRRTFSPVAGINESQDLQAVQPTRTTNRQAASQAVEPVRPVASTRTRAVTPVFVPVTETENPAPAETVYQSVEENTFLNERINLEKEKSTFYKEAAEFYKMLLTQNNQPVRTVADTNKQLTLIQNTANTNTGKIPVTDPVVAAKVAATAKPAANDSAAREVDLLVQRLSLMEKELSKLNKQIIENQKILQLPSTKVFFSTGSSRLSALGEQMLQSISSFLTEHKEYGAQLNGYADKTGDPERNMLLSKKRAQSVSVYLISKNISAERIRVSFKGVDTALAGNNLDYARRVEIDVVKFSSVTDDFKKGNNQ